MKRLTGYPIFEAFFAILFLIGAIMAVIVGLIRP
jgi:hypothetical protein